MNLSILLPIIRCRVSAYLQKGKHWSAVEHLVLYEIWNSPKDLVQISERTNLHQSVAAEIASRLMLAGWIELHAEGDRVSFQSTHLGAVEVQKSKLTPATESFTRSISFDIDCLTWTVTRVGRFTNILFPDQAESHASKTKRLVKLQPSQAYGPRLNGIDLLELISEHDEILESDESIHGYNRDNTFVSGRYALIDLMEPEWRGLAGPANQLKDVIEDQLNKYPDKNFKKSSFQVSIDLSGKQTSSNHENVSLSADDILVGGQRHLAALKHALENAKSYIVIVSTFIREGAVKSVLEDIVKAACRGIELYLLWDEANGEPPKWCRKLGLPENVHLLPVPLNSHAKIMIWNEDRTVNALVGFV